jgi:hypothetical protein
MRVIKVRSAVATESSTVLTGGGAMLGGSWARRVIDS